MRFLQSPNSIDQQIQKKLSDSDRIVRDIKLAQLNRMAAFDAEVAKLSEQLDTVINGSTPADAVDVRALRAFLRKNGTGSSSDLQAVKQTV